MARKATKRKAPSANPNEIVAAVDNLIPDNSKTKAEEEEELILLQFLGGIREFKKITRRSCEKRTDAEIDKENRLSAWSWFWPKYQRKNILQIKLGTWDKKRKKQFAWKWFYTHWHQFENKIFIKQEAQESDAVGTQSVPTSQVLRVPESKTVPRVTPNVPVPQLRSQPSATQVTNPKARKVRPPPLKRSTKITSAKLNPLKPAKPSHTERDTYRQMSQRLESNVTPDTQNTSPSKLATNPIAATRDGHVIHSIAVNDTGVENRSADFPIDEEPELVFLGHYSNPSVTPVTIKRESDKSAQPAAQDMNLNEPTSEMSDIDLQPPTPQVAEHPTESREMSPERQPVRPEMPEASPYGMDSDDEVGDMLATGPQIERLLECYKVARVHEFAKFLECVNMSGAVQRKVLVSKICQSCCERGLTVNYIRCWMAGIPERLQQAPTQPPEPGLEPPAFAKSEMLATVASRLSPQRSGDTRDSGVSLERNSTKEDKLDKEENKYEDKKADFQFQTLAIFKEMRAENERWRQADSDRQKRVEQREQRFIDAQQQSTQLIADIVMSLTGDRAQHGLRSHNRRVVHERRYDHYEERDEYEGFGNRGFDTATNQPPGRAPPGRPPQWCTPERYLPDRRANRSADKRMRKPTGNDWVRFK